jgi:hypothetical protein
MFIDPEPALVHRLIGDVERANVRSVGERVQDVPVGLFDSLATGDLLFEVLPRLASGVTVHLHDIFPAFEYVELTEGGPSVERALRPAGVPPVHHLISDRAVALAALAGRSGAHGRARPATGANPGGSLYLRRVAPPA